jgi:hypothetical protein
MVARVVSTDGSFSTMFEADAAKMEAQGAIYRGRGRPIVRDTVRTKRGDSAGWASTIASKKTWRSKLAVGLQKLKKTVIKYVKFMGPGFLVSVAYIDPGTLFPSPLHSKEERVLNSVSDRQLCNRCSGWRVLPLPPSLHDPSL